MFVGVGVGGRGAVSIVWGLYLLRFCVIGVLRKEEAEVRADSASLAEIECSPWE